MSDLPSRTPSDSSSSIHLADLTMRIARDRSCHTLALIGELDLASAEAVDAELRCIESSGAARIVLDLRRLTFMDAIGIRLFVAAAARSRADSDRLRILRPPPQVYRVFDICGVSDDLPLDD